MKQIICTVAVAMLLLATAGLLSGCGQKGPLYLPDQAQPQQQPK
ncbi:MAG TPA: hypothetical protein ENK38_04845 [Gammaproteobacteria bacterium]|nr:hypothetical protein [Gammaproteobacteria bacterium]